MELTWQQLYDHAVQNFGGQHPGRQLEADIVDIYAERPDAVRNAIDKAARAYANGTIHSPWGVIRTELSRDTERAHVTPGRNTRERDKAIGLAERYIRLAGCGIPSPTELIVELFGAAHERGTRDGHLHPWADDTELQQRMIALWQTHQEDSPR